MAQMDQGSDLRPMPRSTHTMKLWHLLPLLALISQTAALAAEFHVSIKGNDSNDGSMGRPYRTISAAARVARVRARLPDNVDEPVIAKVERYLKDLGRHFEELCKNAAAKFRVRIAH